MIFLVTLLTAAGGQASAQTSQTWELITVNAQRGAQRLTGQVIGGPSPFSQTQVSTIQLQNYPLGLGFTNLPLGAVAFYPGVISLEGAEQGFSLSGGLVFNTPKVPTAAGTYALASGSEITVAYNGGAPVAEPLTGSVTISYGDSAGKYLGLQKSQPDVGEPINVGSGNVFDQVTDYKTDGLDTLSFSRFYNSLSLSSTLATSLGSNWRSNYDRYINVLAPGLIAAERPDGQVLTFFENGSSWTSDSDVSERLSQSGSVWTLTTIDGTIETYRQISGSPVALLNSISHRGYYQSLRYDASNRLIAVTDSFKRALNITYKGNLINTVTTPDGLILTYNFDAGGTNGSVLDRLDTVNYNTSPSTKTTYLHENPTLPYAVTAVVDENNSRYISWTYDSSGRGLSSQFGNGALLTTVSYNDGDGSRVVTSPLGEKDTYLFSELQNVPKVTEIDRAATSNSASATELMTYDANGYIASTKDWNGNLTTYINDVLGRPTSVVEAVGTSAQRSTTTSFAGNWNLPAKIITQNLSESYTYDGNGSVLSCAKTDMSAQSSPYSTRGQTRTWRYTWNDGLLTSEQEPRTDTVVMTRYIYDASGALTEAINSLSQPTYVVSHTPGGYPLEEVDSNGITTSFTYDVRMRQTKIVTNGLTYGFNYDYAGNLIGETLPDGSQYAYSYDAAHRRTSQSNLLNESIVTIYDANSDVAEQETFDGKSNLCRKEVYSYNSLGQRIRWTTGAGQTTTYEYDSNGNLINELDGRKYGNSYAYDALNRIFVFIDRNNGVTNSNYNDKNEPLTVQSPNKAVTSYVYNGFGEKIQEISPDSGTTTFTYDADGNIIQSVDGAGHVRKASFDALDRVSTNTYPANAGENVTYTYDQGGHGSGVGRLTSLVDAAGSLQLSYDFRGALTSEVRTSVLGTFSTSFGHDLVGRLATVIYPSGAQISYLRDDTGQTTEVNLTPVNGHEFAVAQAITHAPFGPLTSLRFGNNVSEARSYDGDYRVTQIADTGANPLLSLALSYDAAGNVQSIQDVLHTANNQTFGYDPIGRLSAAQGAYGTLDYSYDHNGNRAAISGATSSSYSYASGSNRLNSLTAGATPQTFGYTGSGAISSDGDGRTFTYDQNNRLVTANQGATQLGAYTYDAFGCRIEKVSAHGSKEFSYDLRGELLEETADSSMPTTDYIYLDDGRLLAVLEPLTGTIGYILTDHLGSPQAALSSSQQSVWNAINQPFGAVSSTGAVTINLRFTGQYYDSETGFNQNGFRDYVPSLGRYLESDPIGLAGGQNTYSYVEQNPLRWIDRNGLCRAQGSALDTTDLTGQDLLDYIGLGAVLAAEVFDLIKYDNTGNVFGVLGSGFAYTGLIFAAVDGTPFTAEKALSIISSSISIASNVASFTSYTDYSHFAEYASPLARLSLATSIAAFDYHLYTIRGSLYTQGFVNFVYDRL